MNFEGRKEIYGILKMSVNLQNDPHNYMNALTFWKAVEAKYKERKRRWMEANARMVAAKLTAIRARKEMEEAQREATEARNRHDSFESYEDAKDDEFSDVDRSMFVDPGARYYSSLDAHGWQKIRGNLMSIYQRGGTYYDLRFRYFLRKLLLVAIVLFGLLYAAHKVFLQWSEEVRVAPRNPCKMNCGQPTMLDTLIQVIMPLANDDDEV